MSWQAYVDSSLVGTGHIDKGAIISAAGDSAWATSAGFTVFNDPCSLFFLTSSPTSNKMYRDDEQQDLSGEEMKNLVNILNKAAGASDKAYADGVYVAGERYVVFRIEDRSVYLRQGRTGVVVVKTKQAVIVGHYGETQQVGNATQTAEALADYLIKVGY
ncbi:Profilin/allergen [Annulohypoxylon nitens]|nr:Profilin/allergen [Annulohypoxylon nitens]